MEPKIIETTQSDNGVIVAFSDERTAYYSAALLYAMLPKAREIAPVEDEGV